MTTPGETESDSLAAALNKLGARMDPVIQLMDQLHQVFFWIKDTKGCFCWVNTAVVLRRGLRSRAEMIGKSDLDYYEPARANQYRSDDLYVLAGNEIRDRIEEVTVNHIQGWFSTSKVPLRDRRGRVVGTAGLAMPISRPDRATGRGAYLEAAIQYINQHYGEPVKNSVLAKRCGMSLGNFQRQFRATYHCSPHTYVRELRVRLSCRALAQSELSLAAIAEEHGFADQSHFNKEFRRMMGETPRAYRRRFRTGPDAGTKA
jgi:AraC-like DNA-binding protein